MRNVCTTLDNIRKDDRISIHTLCDDTDDKKLATDVKLAALKSGIRLKSKFAKGASKRLSRLMFWY